MKSEDLNEGRPHEATQDDLDELADELDDIARGEQEKRWEGAPSGVWADREKAMSEAQAEYARADVPQHGPTPEAQEALDRYNAAFWADPPAASDDDADGA
jgi:hypothetical protein